MLAQGSHVSLAPPCVEPWGASFESARTAQVNLDTLAEILRG
jgi:hypothetical protein